MNVGCITVVPNLAIAFLPTPPCHYLFPVPIPQEIYSWDNGNQLTYRVKVIANGDNSQDEERENAESQYFTAADQDVHVNPLSPRYS